MRITIPTAARIVLTVLVVLLVGTGSAFADSCINTATNCTYDLHTVNTSTLGSLSTYGTVQLTLNGSNNIDFLINIVSGYRIFGGFGFNSSISPDPGSLTVSASSDSTNWPTGTLSLNPAANNFDGFGNFEYVLNGPNSQTNGTQTLSFTVQRSGGFTSIQQLVEGSTGGGSLVPALFSSHLAQISTGNTGFVGAKGTAVPEPSSYLWLMGAGFGLIVLVFERRRRRTA